MTVHATWFYSYEACKTHDAEGQRLIKKAFASASEKGVTVHSVYSNRPEHTMFMVLEADTFEQIDDFLEGKDVETEVADKLIAIYLRTQHKRQPIHTVYDEL